MVARAQVRQVESGEVEDLAVNGRKGIVAVHAGESLDTLGARVVDAMKRAQRNEGVRERHLGFESWEGLVRLLSPKRLELLRHAHASPAKNVRALALALGRDYHRVHEDVQALEEAGLVERDKEGVRATYDALDVHVRVKLGERL
jgi:predicted transcriptional regulator